MSLATTLSLTEQYLELLRQTVDLGQWAKAVQAVLKQAQDGHLKAFAALAKYLRPLPAQRLRVSADSDERFRVAGYTPASPLPTGLAAAPQQAATPQIGGPFVLCSQQ